MEAGSLSPTEGPGAEELEHNIILSEHVMTISK